jgi:hypothetical protein
MPENDFLEKIKEMGFQITPSALEVVKNSHIEPDQLIKEINQKWTEKEKIITVNKAINIILSSSEYVDTVKKITDEIKKYIPSEPAIPRKLRLTYFVLKKSQKTLLAGDVARITHRKRKTEQIYLNQLTDLNYIVQSVRNDGKKIYQVKD